MAHRLLVNLVFTGASVFGKAFTEAYKQAAKALAAGGAAAGPARSASTGGIPVDEALKILDLDRKDLNLAKVKEKYEYLFDVNSKDKGNLFYLQSKIYYAMDTLQREVEFLQKMKQEKSGQST